MLKPTSLLLVFAALAFAAPAIAAPAKLNVDFGYFPKGTTCQVFGTTGKVRFKAKSKEFEYRIKGDTGNVSFRCQQPDGRTFEVSTAALLPSGSPKLVSIQINQDDQAHVLWDDGGLRRASTRGILKWK